MRVAAYARFSSDNQREASIEDQLRICREFAAKQSWKIVAEYTDAGISGASLIRPGIQALLRDAAGDKFDLVLSEALDRISRDQEDIAGVYKRLQFAGIKMHSLSEGEISTLHIGLKGTMNALFLKDLADKTRRGLRGRVEAGKSGGGITYGYDNIKRVDPKTNEYARGERAINERQATIVRRIFQEYNAGSSPRAIALRLNKEGVPGPRGGTWGPSTIHGNRDRGTGILNNELYRGRLLWNRLRYMKDPSTGKRVSKHNPESEWITTDVSELRIIPDELWDSVKRLQGEINRHDTPLWSKNRPRNIFSHLIRCGCCGGGISMVSATMLGCSNARNKGTCDNKRRFDRQKLEAMVLTALRDHLMDEELCAEFCREYTRRMNELKSQHNASLSAYRAEMAKLERETQQIIRSISEGVPGALLKDRAVIIQNRKEELQKLLADVKEEPVLFHPNMANRYQVEIRNLIHTLGSDGSAEATTLLYAPSLIRTHSPILYVRWT